MSAKAVFVVPRLLRPIQWICTELRFASYEVQTNGVPAGQETTLPLLVRVNDQAPALVSVRVPGTCPLGVFTYPTHDLLDPEPVRNEVDGVIAVTVTAPLVGIWLLVTVSSGFRPPCLRAMSLLAQPL